MRLPEATHIINQFNFMWLMDEYSITISKSSRKKITMSFEYLYELTPDDFIDRPKIFL